MRAFFYTIYKDITAVTCLVAVGLLLPISVAQAQCPGGGAVTWTAGASVVSNKVCDNTAFTISVSHASFSSYQWLNASSVTLSNGANYNNVTSAQLSVLAPQVIVANSPLSYIVSVTCTGAGSPTATYSIPNAISVQPLPTVAVATTNALTAVCEGATINTLQASCSANCGTMAYTWAATGYTISGGTVSVGGTGNSNATVTLTNSGAGTIGFSVVGTRTVASEPSCAVSVTSYSIPVNDVTEITNISITNAASAATVVAPSADATVCANTAVTLTAGSAGFPCTGCLYSWNSNVSGALVTNSTDATNVTYVIANPTATSTYGFTLTNAAGCSDTEDAVVNVNPRPTFTLGNYEFCAGTTGAITASVLTSPTATYSWTGAAGLTGTSGGTNNVANFLSATAATFSVTPTATNASTGCTATATANITINALPTITIESTSNNVCQGASSVTLSRTNCLGPCTDPGFGAYSWSGGTPALSSSNSTANPTPTATSTYTLLYTNNKGCTASDNETVNVYATPTISLVPLNTEYCSGAPITIDASLAAVMTTAPTSTAYSWNSNANNATTEDVNVTISATRTYTLTTTYDYGVTACAAIASTAITANPIPSIQLPDVVTCTGNTFTYTPTSSGGTGATTIAWTLPGGSTVANATSVTVNTGATETTDVYNVTITDSKGCTSTDPGTVQIYECGNEQISYNQAVYCQGDPIIVSVVGASPSADFEWLPDNQTTSSITITPAPGVTSISGSVRVRVDGILVANKPYNVNIQIPAPTIAGPTAVCQGELTTLNVATCTGCSSYTWGVDNTPATLSPIGSGVSVEHTPNIGGVMANYIVTATDGNGCTGTDNYSVWVKPLPDPNITPQHFAFYCPESSVFIDANPSSCTSCDYLWSSGHTTQIINVNSPGTYTVTVTQDGCSDTARVVAQPRVSPQPIITDINGTAMPSVANPYLVLCDGVPEQLLAAGCATCSFEWNTGSTADTISVTTTPSMYYVEGVDSNGCYGISQPVIAMNSTTGVNSVATASPSVICNGDSAMLTVAPCVGCTYDWFINGNSTPIATNTRTKGVLTAGIYYAQITNAQGCIFFSNTVNVTASPVTPPPIYASTDTLCSGNTVELSTLNDPNNQYQWYLNGNIISAATDTVYVSSIAGAYHVDVTYPNGCVLSSNTKTVLSGTFTRQIEADTFGVISSTVVCDGDSVLLFTNLNPGYQYQWYRDGLILSGETSASIFAKSEGDYYLVVTSLSGCTDITNSINVRESSLSSNTLTVDDYTVCPGDSTRIRASLCVGCSYQWYRGNTILTGSTNSTYYASTAGSYYAIVSNLDGCSIASDTVAITIEGVLFPSLSTSSPRICNGVTPVLTTPNCVGCNYSWLQNGVAIFGALNDTSYVVGSINTIPDIGDYSVIVTYATGCLDTSNVITIVDGSFVADIATPGGVICNGTAQTLTADCDGAACPGGSTYEWFFESIPVFFGGVPTYGANTTTTGGYSVKITQPNGCYEISDTTLMTAINLAPIITSDASDICGGNPVTMTVSNSCAGCTYEWFRGYTTSVSVGSPIFSTSTVGIYTVNVTQNGCTATSNPITLNAISGLNVSVNVSDTSICDGDSITLYRVAGNCSGCVYQWYRDGVAIPAATLYTYTTNIGGDYTLEMTQTTNNCIDTSAVILIREVNATAGFQLVLDPYTPMTVTGGTLDLDLGVSPPYLQGGFNNGRFTNSPLTATGDTTLFGTHNNIFDPAISGSGFHQITFYYDTLGCTFTASDLVFVLAAPSINITNTNILADQYEACIFDTLVIAVSNMPFPIANVYAFNQQDVYTPMTILSYVSTPAVYGNQTVYNDTIVVVVEEWAKESYFNLESPTFDTVLTPYVLIHNYDLTFAGLPTTLCSNGDSVTLVTNPSGGYFTALYPDGTSVSAAAVSGTTIYPTFFDQTKYTQDSMVVTVFYNYPHTYTNGNACAVLDTTLQTTVARAVFLTDVNYNNISISQSRELLTNLVYSVTPYTSSPSQWQHGFAFSGSFTDPVGSPLDFLPSNAGVGLHPVTYTILNGVCSNSVLDNINVIAAPTPLAIADTICRNNAPVTFNRESIFTYFAYPPNFVAPGITYNDTVNILSVTSINNNEGIDTINASLGLEQFMYDPSQVTGIYDTIRITYSFNRIEYVAGVPFDTINYVVASITLPIYIDTLINVEIIDTIVNPVYCEEDVNFLLAGNPFNGYFELFGGSGQYATGDTVDFAIFNPLAIHGNESADVNYMLVYTVAGVACLSKDTMNVLIPEPLNAAFATASGKNAYCDSEPADPISVATPNNAPSFPIGSLLVGGVAQSTLQFDPLALDPGIYLVQYQVTDLWGCTAMTSDTFEVYPLPDVYFSLPGTNTPAFAPSYCTNDSSFYFEVHPAPICAQSIGTGTIVLNEGFENPLFPPSGWQRYNINPAGANWELSAFNSNTGNNNAFVNVSSNQQNTWLITPPIAMTVGNVYRLQYYVRAGAQNCPTCADASMKVSVVQATSLLAHQSFGTVLFDATALTNEIYIPVTHDYICPVSGNYTFAFNNYSSNNLARSLRLDDVSVTEISSSSCVSGGIGSIFGSGLTYAGDSTYFFQPTTLTPGAMEIKYVFINTNGCLDSASAPMNIYQHVTPTIVGLDPSYCVNSPTDTLSSMPNDGAFGSGFTTIGMVDPVTTNLRQLPKPHYDPNIFTSGEVIQYTYVDPATGCVDIDRDTVVVLDMPDTLTYANLASAYCEQDAPFAIDVQVLAGGPLNGIFYGPGVINGSGGPTVTVFSPAQAVLDMGNIGDTVITYIYPLPNGCVDTLRKDVRINAMPDLTFTNLPDSICLNNDPLLIIVNNHEVSGPSGNIQQNILLSPGAGIFTGAVMNAGDSLVPQQVTAGSYPVSFTYTDANGCTSSIYDTVRVDTVPVIYFTFAPTSPDSIFCELNDPGSLLLAYPAYYPGSGYLQIGAQVFDRSFFQIDPAAMATPPNNALYPIFYEFTDFHGCTGTGTDSIEVRPYPRIDMTQLPTTFCDADTTTLYDMMADVTPIGGIFSDDQPVTTVVDSQYLDLGMPAGDRVITYYYLDPLTGCYNSESVAIEVFNTPSFDFEAVGGCVGEEIRFIGETIDLEPGLDSITNVTWNFGTASYSYLPADPTEIGDTIYTYPTNGVYNVQLSVTNQGMCTALIQRQVIVSPTINTYPYAQDFESGNDGWYADQPDNTGANLLWGQTTLGGAHINDPANTAWKTVPNAPYTYQANDRGWVLTPCFDLRPLDRPMVSMDMWKDMNLSIDGANMEYFDTYTNSWQTLGASNRGINWYGSSIILSRPGNQANTALPVGWTDTSSTWKPTRYRLDDLMYRNFVRFRIAFAAFNTVNPAAYEGLAFDNFWLGNRYRNVLLEHFSNENLNDVDEVDEYVYDLVFNQNYGRDVILIQYQTDIDDLNHTDENNVLNPTDPSARVLIYGVNDNNQAKVDGTPRGSGYSDELSTYDLDFDMLQFASFNIQITQMDVINGTVQTSATVTALEYMPEDDYAVFSAVIEDTVASDAGHNMQAVLRRMLPGAAGETHYRFWNPGDAVVSSNFWDPATSYGGFTDPTNLHLVVFIQNMSTEEIFQAATTRDVSIYFPPDTVSGTDQPAPTSLADFEITKLKVYPNPAVDYFNVEFEQPTADNYKWRLVNHLGQTLQTGTTPAGTKVFSINTYNLPSGSYFFQMQDGRVMTQRQVVVRRP